MREVARDLINTGDCEGPGASRLPTGWFGADVDLLIIGAGTSANRLFRQNKFLEYFVGEQSPARRQADEIFPVFSISPSSTNSAIVRRAF